MKNYTSTVPANRSIMHIEELLAKNGAINISKHYENGTVSSIFFQIEIKKKIFPFKLPVNSNACYLAMSKKIKRVRPSSHDKLRRQAERTTWKILSDWTDIQLSLIEMEQAEFMQVFLPYIFTSNMTFYEKLKQNDFKQLTYKNPKDN